MIYGKEIIERIESQGKIYQVKIIPKNVENYVKKKSKKPYRIMNTLIYDGVGQDENHLKFHDSKNENIRLEFFKYQILDHDIYCRRKSYYDSIVSEQNILVLLFFNEDDAKNCFERYLSHYLNLLKGQNYQRQSYLKRHHIDQEKKIEGTE